MGLKVIVSDLNDVQEELRSFYSETDSGAFVLQVEGVDDHPEVKNLKNAYTAEKAKRAEYSGKVQTLEAKLTELENKPAPTAKDDAEMIRLRAAIEAERDDYKAKFEAAEKRVYGLTVETQLDGLIRDVGITEAAFAKAAKTMLSQNVKLVNDSPIVETDMGPVPLSEHVKRWAAGEGKAFVAKPVGGGAGGSGGGSGGKVISATELEKMSPTEKASYFRANPGVTVEG
jgi:hypothetical protein